MPVTPGCDAAIAQELTRGRLSRDCRKNIIGKYQKINGLAEGGPNKLLILNDLQFKYRKTKGLTAIKHVNMRHGPEDRVMT
jgi:hypothetical protein